MPYSSGTFSRVHDFTTDRDAGIKIQASRMDAEMDGIATGLSTAILKDGTQTTTAVVPFAFGISIVDNKAITLGTNSDITIQYDETTNDSLEIAAAVEGAALGIVLKSDQGDDNADQHKLSIADGGTLTLASKISGSFVTYLTHTPNSTVASSTLAVAGNLTVGGNLTLGSGAELSEAELEMLDGITAGTVAASKAVVVDANKDIASFRNITLTGELDAGSLDVSGDADIDGTLEADAITVGGTALNTVIAGVTVTNATNSAHVLVTDNESTNEENLITFVEGATDSTGNVGLEMDGNLSYNPSTGTVTATVFKGNIDAVDGDFDGTLEADAMTLNGSAITTTATLSTGISNGNVLVATSGIADNDFLRVDGTSIEGRSASEVLSDIGASAVAGSSSIVTTGALDSGSITSGFGAIDNGSSNITTTGVGSFGSLDISGDIDVDGTTNLDVVDIDGAVDMASTLAVSGDATIGSLFVDVSTDSVGIGTTSVNIINSNDTHLDVRSSGTYAFFELGKTATITSGDIAYMEFLNGNNNRMASIAGGADGANNDGYMRFSTLNAGSYTEAMRINHDQIITMPKQPAFLATPATAQNNIALNTAVTVVLGTEVFDNNGDFASNTFTAPVTGKYQLSMLVGLQQLDSGHTFSGANIITSNRNYLFTIDNAADFSQDFSENPFSTTLSILADMDAGDTAHLTVQCQGGTQQTDIYTGSFFSGYLVA
jgi:hypothetical protein